MWEKASPLRATAESPTLPTRASAEDGRGTPSPLRLRRSPLRKTGGLAGIRQAEMPGVCDADLDAYKPADQANRIDNVQSLEEQGEAVGHSREAVEIGRESRTGLWGPPRFQGAGGQL